MDLSILERALSYAKTQPDDVALYIYKGAIERFLASNKPYGSPKQQPQPSNKVDPDFLKRMEDMIKNQPKGCPKCGAIGSHFCTGKRPEDNYVTLPYKSPSSVGTGIEYLSNQPTAICNFDTNPRRDEILAHIFGQLGGSSVGAMREARNAHQTGGQGAGKSSSKI